MFKSTWILKNVSLPLIVLISLACKKDDNNELLNPIPEPIPAYQITREISYNGVSVDVVIDKPEGNAHDVLMVFHGTVMFDSLILQAAHNSLNAFKNLLNEPDLMLVSVAYPEENLLFGDNNAHCEAALLWLKNNASNELGVEIKSIFLAGHSQGGYHATRLNTLHITNGVIANAPGPLNLVYRCELEEHGQMPNGIVCNLLNAEYGPPSENPEPYFARSLMNFTSGFKSDILFVQGMQDSPIQMYSWPTFKTMIQDCSNCQESIFLELPGLGHNALFASGQAKQAFNSFIDARR